MSDGVLGAFTARPASYGTGDWEILDADGVRLAVCYGALLFPNGTCRHFPARHNAHLFAAARDLLRIAEKLVEEANADHDNGIAGCYHCGGGGGFTHAADCIVIAAQVAIAKAEEETP